jgi:hypothetical protein
MVLEINWPCFEQCAVCTELSFGLGPVLHLAEARHEGLGFKLIGSIARGEAGHPVDLELCGKTCLDLAIGFEHADCVNRAGQLAEGGSDPYEFDLLPVFVRGAQNLREIGLKRSVPSDIGACRCNPVTKRYFVPAHALVTSPLFTRLMPRGAVTCPRLTMISSPLAASA